MYFAGSYSKFNEGDSVWLISNGKPSEKVVIKTIGILGSKLSKHEFLYHVITDNGKSYDVLENCLISNLDK